MAEETLMTEPAATPTEGQPASNQAPTTDTSVQGAEPQQAPEGKTADATTDAGDKQQQGGDQDKPAEKAGAPEQYEFKLPDGAQMDDAGLAAFSEFAKELDLPQEAAQAMLDKMAPAMAKRQADMVAKVQQDWMNLSTSDKEFGGEKLTENLAVAKKALDTFGTPELRTLLNESGLGNHPEIIRAFYRAGKQISEDRFVPGSQGKPTGGKDYAKSLYPNQQT